MEQMTAVSLFAGVGGFDLALERNGVKVVAAAEIDKHARSVLSRHFPDTYLYDDVRKVNADGLRANGFVPERGIITGGFPCQDLSVAGKRLGFGGQRSSLFYEIARIADETKARWLVLENVPGLLSSQRGADMGAVVGTLVELGYCVGWRVLDAQYFGVPQRRRRVFIVAERVGNPTRCAQILFEPTSLRGDFAASRAQGQETAGTVGEGSEVAGAIVEPTLYEPHHGDGRAVQGRANTLNARMGTGGNNLPVLIEPIYGFEPGAAQRLNTENRINKDLSPTLRANMGDNQVAAGPIQVEEPVSSTTSNYSEVAGWEKPVYPSLLASPPSDTAGLQYGIRLGASVRRLTPVECERLQGFPDGWTEFGADPTKPQADSHRYKQMGNAVAVPVVEWLIGNLVRLENPEK